MPATPVFFSIVFEDSLSEAVIERLLKLSPMEISIVRRINGRGSGYIRSRIRSFFSAAVHQEPFLVLMDSDKEDCALHLLDKLVPPGKRNRKCLFRIVIREIESWLLADTRGISQFLGISEAMISRRPETLADPKDHLIQLARRSKKKDIADALVPAPGTSVVVGPEYNQTLVPFVRNIWDINSAAKRSESLRRAVEAIITFGT
jgi:hypothetical protein